MKDYRSKHKVDYEEPAEIAFTSVQCLSFLIGRKWDQLSLNYVHSLRPSSIRVTTGVVGLYFRLWRVTVYVSEENIIKEISQEVEVGCGGFKHADDMSNSLNPPEQIGIMEGLSHQDQRENDPSKPTLWKYVEDESN